jgi:hypothetical protein
MRALMKIARRGLTAMHRAQDRALARPAAVPGRCRGKPRSDQGPPFTYPTCPSQTVRPDFRLHHYGTRAGRPSQRSKGPTRGSRP